MNIKAIESQENFAKKVLSMSQERQNEFFNNLKSILNKEEIENIMKLVSLFDMFTDKRKYKAMEQQAMANFIQEVR